MIYYVLRGLWVCKYNYKIKKVTVQPKLIDMPSSGNGVLIRVRFFTEIILLHLRYNLLKFFKVHFLRHKEKVFVLFVINYMCIYHLPISRNWDKKINK